MQYRLFRSISIPFRIVVELVLLPLLIFFSLLSRLFVRPIDIGIGPEPLINNIYHKKALIQQGYSVETFVDKVYFITKDFDRVFIPQSVIVRTLFHALNIMYLFSIFQYRCLYLYFNGGPLKSTFILWRFEPQLYRLAGVRIVIMPYGSDVQDLTRTPNLLFRHVVNKDYPLSKQYRKIIAHKIDIWSKYADHVISGCDWVDYMFYWDTLMVAHFSIDIKLWHPIENTSVENDLTKPLRVLHAPNHREIKGSDYFIHAIEELRAEGEFIELVLVEKLPNEEIRRLINTVDLVADQLIIGWYAMFAIESMAMGKPVICYLREDLKQLYINAGLIGENEIPLIDCSPANVKSVLRELLHDPSKLRDAGLRGPEYVRRHHSTESVGEVFTQINKAIGINKASDNIIQ